ncbi:MAG TPA: tripartite tricarboxylate transporter substrate-binding protein [Burkholderiales bacterium]|nr:tripartite tricarboxylate transporter substrate-binding protein [Burkholderiales bacterium]
MRLHSTFPGRLLAAVLGALSALAGSEAASAQDCPSRPYRSLVGYTPGGSADILARAAGRKLAGAWGQQVIVENRPGAGTNIATEIAAKSAPEGYTLVMPAVANAIDPSLYPKLHYEPLRGFSCAIDYAKVPGIVVVRPSVPVKNVQELVALAKARPDEPGHGSTGIGSPHHLAGALFKSMAGVKRVAAVPQIAARDEQGLEGFETGSWFGTAVPAEGAEFVGEAPEQFTAFVRSEIAEWGWAVEAWGAGAERGRG